MSLTKILICFLNVLILFATHAGSYNNNWHFGNNACVNFSSGLPLNVPGNLLKQDYLIFGESDEVREITRINGTGNSTQTLHYCFNDYQFSSEIMYFQLIQVVYVGASTISYEINIQFDFQGIEIYLNPSNGVFTIRSNEEITSIKTTESYGKTIVENVNTTIGLSEFANGLYYVVIVSDNGITVKKRLKI